MTGIQDPSAYDAWYHTSRGAWISRMEFSLLRELLPLQPRGRLLDVGCGSGHFSRLFANQGFSVTGIDPDVEALHFARRHDPSGHYVQGSVEVLPFPDKTFDVCCAVTSLCFVSNPVRALDEMWRVSRSGIVLGLLNRHSMLYLLKRGRGAYSGARWDTGAEVRKWCRGLMPQAKITAGSVVWLPSGGPVARSLETWMPRKFLSGGFLGVGLLKP